MHQHKLLRCHWFSLIPYWWQKSSFHIIWVQFWHPPMLLNQTWFHKRIRYQTVRTKEYQWSNTTLKSDWGHTWSVLVKSSRAVKSFTQTCQMCWTRTKIMVITPAGDRSSMRQPIVVTFCSRKISWDSKPPRQALNRTACYWRLAFFCRKLQTN